MRLLGYTRVSTAKPEVRLQADALTFAGVEPGHVFSDVTGANEAADRPGMRRLLEYATEGDTIVVWGVDRLGRSLSDVLDTVVVLSERGIDLRSVQDGIDSTTANGRLILELLVRLAEYERHLNGERIASGMAAAREAGTTLGRPPLDPETIRDKLSAVEEARFRGLTAADAAQLVGWSRTTFYRHKQEYGARE